MRVANYEQIERHESSRRNRLARVCVCERRTKRRTANDERSNQLMIVVVEKWCFVTDSHLIQTIRDYINKKQKQIKIDLEQHRNRSLPADFHWAASALNCAYTTPMKFDRQSAIKNANDNR